MTPQKARKLLWIVGITTAVILLVLILIVIYALGHPVRRLALLMVLATLLGPLFLTLFFRKAGIKGLLDRDSAIDPKSIKVLLRRHPMIFIVFPLLITAIVWGFLLVTLAVKEGGDVKEWARSHGVLTALWIMTPQVVAAYLLVALHAPYVGLYVAGCLVYMTVTTAIGGIKLENGVVGFFGSYKAQASPLVVLSSALICAASFGILHYAVWSMWPHEYLNMHGIEDAMYFSIVTMATVGYGDILPVGRAARGLCVSEILSGVLLLVVGVSATMTIWLQTNQPAPCNSTTDAPLAAEEANQNTLPASRSDS